VGNYVKSMSNSPISPEFVFAASAGLVADTQVLFAVGHVANVGTASPPIDVCEQGTLYPFLATAQILKVSSASAADTAAGTGARAVIIQGLDANFNQIQETVIMNGVAAVNTVNAYLRVNSFYVSAAGSGQINALDITLQLVAGGSAQGIIRAGIGVSQQAVLTVPNGFVGVLTAAQFSMAGSPATNFGQVALNANVGGPTARVNGVRSDINSGFPYNEAVLIGFPNPPQTDITARIISVGQNSTEISAGFQIVLLRQNYLTAN